MEDIDAERTMHDALFKVRTEEEWIEEYTARQALWIHDDNPKRPHVRLRSGKHSSGFFNSELVLEDPKLADEIAEALVAKLLDADLDLENLNRVVGPAMGAINFAHDVARWASDGVHDGKILRAYTEKSNKMQVRRGDQTLTLPLADLKPGDVIVAVEAERGMIFQRTKIKRGEKVLLVEDVLTTGSSVALSAETVTSAGGILLPFVGIIVNRSGLTEVDGKKIVALIDKEMPMWTADECPLCKAGSEAIEAKGTENWARLTADY